MEEGEGRPEKGDRRREEGEGRPEKGDRRREKGGKNDSKQLMERLFHDAKTTPIKRNIDIDKLMNNQNDALS